MIDILLNGKAPRWLPAVGKGSQPVLLRPGANKVSPGYWDSVRNHAGVKAMLRTKRIELDVSPVKLREHSHAPDRERGLIDLTVEKAEPWIDACEDLNLLTTWRNADRRKAIHKRIDDRISELG
jgi:hypothetical protein